MSVLSIKVPIQKKSGNLFNDPCTCISVSVPIAFRYFFYISSRLRFAIMSFVSKSIFSTLKDQFRDFVEPWAFHCLLIILADFILFYSRDYTLLFVYHNLHKIIWFQLFLSNTINFHVFI